MLVDRTFTAMVERGSVSVFEYVKHAFPEDSWMRFHQERVTQVALRKAWEPLSSETLLKMERDQGLSWHQKEAAVVGPFLLSLSCP
jgi:hypothetical protein